MNSTLLLLLLCSTVSYFNQPPLQCALFFLFCLSNRAVLPAICVSVCLSHSFALRDFVCSENQLSLSLSLLATHCFPRHLSLVPSCDNLLSIEPQRSLKRRTVVANTMWKNKHLLKTFSASVLLWLMHAGSCSGNEISITWHFFTHNS